jgi:hypothetical protein
MIHEIEICYPLGKGTTTNTCFGRPRDALHALHQRGENQREANAPQTAIGDKVLPVWSPASAAAVRDNAMRIHPPVRTTAVAHDKDKTIQSGHAGGATTTRVLVDCSRRDTD